MNPKQIEWTSEKCNRLYDYAASKPKNISNFFGYQVGEAIVHFCEYFVPDIKNCNVLDYGCGMGHLISQFLKKNINISGIDMSPGEVKYVNDTFVTNPKFHGAKLFDGGGGAV